ncbi:MAG: winged helix-turn-helix domain-containing protein [Acidobacteriota bacterium]
MATSVASDTFRFRDFELDVAAYELRRLGRPVKIGRQAMDVLILLVERRRQLVSRGEIVDRLWGKDVFVDVETGVNTAISKVRQALRDSAEEPSYIETVAGKGYRFIADVAVVPHAPAMALPAEQLERPVSALTFESPPAPGRPVKAPVRSWLSRRLGLCAMVVAVALAAAGFAARTWSTGAASATRVSLAVLPFQNLGSDVGQAYLAAGLTEETSAQLGQIDPDHLTVKGRTLHYQGTTKTAAEIGQELSVDYLLESAVRAEGGQLRVTTTLIRVPDQEHVWSQTYDREVQSLLGLQQELSAAIAQQVRLRLAPGVVSGLARRQTKNADAFDAYLRARYFESRRTAANNALAVQHYRRSIALDPDYALAWAGLSLVLAGGTINGDAPALEIGPAARDAAAHALAANPELAEAQMAVGYVHWLLDWDETGAEAALRNAVRLDPSNARAEMLLGHVLSQAGRQEDAEVAMRRARELEPLEPLSVALSAQVVFQGRDFRAAAEHARRAILLDPSFWIGSLQLAQAAQQLGEPEVALAALADAARLSGSNSKALSLKGYVLATTGQTAAARVVLGQLEERGRDVYVPPYAVALVQAGLGERDAMFASLERACAARDVHLIYLAVDAKWDLYRADPRFSAVVERCGLTALRIPAAAH